MTCDGVYVAVDLLAQATPEQARGWLCIAKMQAFVESNAGSSSRIPPTSLDSRRRPKMGSHRASSLLSGRINGGGARVAEAKTIGIGVEQRDIDLWRPEPHHRRLPRWRAKPVCRHPPVA